MRILRDGELQKPLEVKTVVTVGSYDGVHTGHMAVLQKALKKAKEIGAASCVVTFDPHPLEILRPEKAPKKLTSARQREEIFRDIGIDYLRVISFDQNWAQMSPSEFAKHVFLDELNATYLYVGTDFTFGAKAQGTLATLQNLGKEHGYDVEGIELVGPATTTSQPAVAATGQAAATKAASEKVSSTLIRKAVAQGQIAAVNAMLGRPLQIRSTVKPGSARGHKIGFPTANIELPEARVHPPIGVYAALVHVENETHQAAVNIGIRPTFNETEKPVLEAHLLDYHGDLYGKEIKVDIIEHIRSEKKFSGIEELSAQIETDIEQIREALTKFVKQDAGVSADTP